MYFLRPKSLPPVTQKPQAQCGIRWLSALAQTLTKRANKVQMSADKVQTKCRVVYTTFCIEYQ